VSHRPAPADRAAPVQSPERCHPRWPTARIGRPVAVGESVARAPATLITLPIERTAPARTTWYRPVAQARVRKQAVTRTATTVAAMAGAGHLPSSRVLVPDMAASDAAAVAKGQHLRLFHGHRLGYVYGLNPLPQHRHAPRHGRIGTSGSQPVSSPFPTPTDPAWPEQERPVVDRDKRPADGDERAPPPAPSATCRTHERKADGADGDEDAFNDTGVI
jgi:hypothetical protein